MRFGLLSLLALYGGLLVGCGTALNYIPTSEPPRPLYVRSADKVEIFMTKAPNRPFVEIGMIESQQQEASLDNEQQVIAKMRQFAGERGCDALVIFSSNDATVTSGGPSYTSSNTLKGYRGSCLVYTGSEPGAAATPAAATATAATAPSEVPPTAAAGTCMPNSTQLCYGPGGCRGGQRCTEDGRSFTLCDCGNVSSQSSQP